MRERKIFNSKKIKRKKLITFEFPYNIIEVTRKTLY
jgi:hypothetical protein